MQIGYPMKLKLAKCRPEAILPKYAHRGDSGFDFHTVDDVVIQPKQRVALHTGIKAMLDQEWEIQVRPRSGIALKTPLTVHFGTVDSGYRGEIKVIVENTSSLPIKVEKGERIAQGVLSYINPASIFEINEEEIKESERGGEGFGSTGGSSLLEGTKEISKDLPNKTASAISKRGLEWLAFSNKVFEHIENYTVPQYGDKGDDQASDYSVTELVRGAKKYLERHGKNQREGNDLLDILKTAHYSQMVYTKMVDECPTDPPTE